MLYENEEEEIEERRDICPLNADGPRLTSLAEEDCWLIGPFELELAQLEDELFSEEAPRVALRSLFAAPPDTPDR